MRFGNTKILPEYSHNSPQTMKSSLHLPKIVLVFQTKLGLGCNQKNHHMCTFDSHSYVKGGPFFHPFRFFLVVYHTFATWQVLVCKYDQWIMEIKKNLLNNTCMPKVSILKRKHGLNKHLYIW